MPKVVIVGSHAAILPFKAVGVDLIPVGTLDDARAELRKIAVDLDEGLVFLPEDVAESCRDELTEIRRKPGVAALVLPSTTGKTGGQREYIRQLVRRSIGVDLMGR